MVNDPLIVSDEPDFFLDYLLRCGLTAPGAAGSPTAGRILARLLVVGAIEAGDELITPYLVPAPGEAAVFEVRTYHPGDLVPTDVRAGLGAGAALKSALRAARESDNGIEVVSRGASGVERCVLVRDSTGDFEFRFATGETMTGDPDACADACAAWTELFAQWRATTVAAAPTVDDLRWAPPTPARGRPIPAEKPVAPAPAAGSPRWWSSTPDDPASREEGEDVGAAAGGTDVEPARRTTDPTNAEAGAGGTGAAVAEMAAPAEESTLVGDAHRAVAEAPAPAHRAEAGRRGEPAAAAAGIGAPAVEAASGTSAEALGAAIQEAIGNLVVEVDLGQVEQLIRRVLDDDRREMVEPLARRLSARIGESLDLPDTRALVDAVSLVLPRPGELADAVAADVSALLSETVLRRRTTDIGSGIDGSTLMAAIEQLHVRVDGLEDQYRRSATMLQAMGEHISAGDRRAASAERVTISVDHEMQRLANRIDEQVSLLAATAGGGSELSDGIARLTRKLRQSVMQLDRALERLDLVFDQVGGPEPSRPALPRGDTERAAPASTPRLPRPASPPAPADESGLSLGPNPARRVAPAADPGRRMPGAEPARRARAADPPGRSGPAVRR